MAENTLPKKNVAFTFYTALVDSGNRPDLKASATLAAGDVQVSTDGAAFGNISTLPVVTPAGGVAIKVDLDATEMNGDNVTVKFIDATGGEWDDKLIEIRPATRKAEDLAYPTTTGRSIDVAATGEVGLDFGNATGAITGAEIGVGAFATAALTADAIATDAIGSDELATTAVNEIRDSIISDATTFQGADIAAILADTLSLDGTKIPDVISLANINAEADTALADINLDHLLFTAVPITLEDAVDTDSVMGHLLHDSTGTGTGGGGFNRETDSLEAIRDQGDSAWITATGFSTHTAENVRTEMDSNSTQLAAIVEDTAEIGTAGVGLSNIPWNAAWDTEVESEVADALAAINLDELVFSPVTTSFDDTVDIDSVIGQLAQDETGTGTSGGGFNRETDSLEAIRNNMQAAVDAAIDTAISELGVATPTATPTLRTGLMLLYMALRNQTIVQTSGTDALEIYNDSGTLIAQKLLTDDGADYTEAEMISG